MKLALMLLLSALPQASPSLPKGIKPENMPMISGLTGPAPKRTYYPVSISDLAAGRNSHTHIRVTGKVVLVKHEADGDLHIRLSDGKHFIVAECIPAIPCSTAPRVGQTFTVVGISRFDIKHRWYEVNPIEAGVVEGGTP